MISGVQDRFQCEVRSVMDPTGIEILSTVGKLMKLERKNEENFKRFLFPSLDLTFPQHWLMSCISCSYNSCLTAVSTQGCTLSL